MAKQLEQLSQAHLRLLTQCPRKYQHNFLDRVFIPTIPSQQQAQADLGKSFHLVMQQYWMGLDIQPILETSPELQRRFQAFQNNPPHLIADLQARQAQHLTEHRRRIQVGQYLLTGIFDLLILTPEAGQIVDWKSYMKPRTPQNLRDSWQTKLYLYLLTETSALEPEQISMTYWFAETSDPAESHDVTFHYSSAQHQQSHKTLDRNLKQLSLWLEAYRSQSVQDFPQVDEAAGICAPEQNPCPYRYRCQRWSKTGFQRSPQSPAQSDIETLLNIDEIPAIPLTSLTPKSEPR